MSDLVSTKNPHGRITNSDFKLAALVLQEETFPFVSANPAWKAPLDESNNMPTVACTFREASIANRVVADLIRLRCLVNCHFKNTPSVFYHPGPQNTIAADASSKFHLVPDIFLSLFSTTYLLPTVSRYVAHLPPPLWNSFLIDLCAVQTAVRGGYVSCENTANNYSD